MVFDENQYDSFDKVEEIARYAHELYEQGKVAMALIQLQEALEINPANSSLRFNKALALDSMSCFEEAIKEYKAALELVGDDLEILNSLAIDYTRVGLYDLAIETFEKIEHIDRDFEPSYCNRIIAYAEMNKHDQAEEMFYLAQQIKPDCGLCFYNIGNSLFIRGQYQKAISCWIKTSKLEPDHPQINFRIAQAYWFDGDYQTSREYFLAELRENPGDIDVIINFGLFLLQLGDTESAKEKFNRVLEFTPDHAQAMFYLGEIAFNKGNFRDAEQLYHRAILSDAALVGPNYRLAQYALKKGQKNQAREFLFEELKLNPEDSEALVSMGSMFLHTGDYDYASHCLVRSADSDNDNPEPYYYLGLVSATRGLLEEADEFFERTLALAPDHIAALKDSAFLCLAMGKYDLAADRIEKAAKLAGSDSEIKSLRRKIKLAKLAGKAEDIMFNVFPHKTNGN